MSDRLPSALGLGLAALGRPGYINLGHAGDLERNYAVAPMQAHAHAVLDAAWQAGIRYFDTALLRPGRGVSGRVAPRATSRPLR